MDNPRGQQQASNALKSLQQLVEGSDEPRVVLARLVDKDGKRLFLPLGLLSSPGKGRVLPKQILVVQPLQKIEYHPEKGCIDRWAFGLPKNIDKVPNFVQQKLETLDTNNNSTWVHWIRNLSEFEEYLSGAGNTAGGEGLLLLAHNSKGRVWFIPDEGRLTQNDFYRKYPPGSVAILAACSAGDLSGDNGILLEELSRSGIDSLVISPFPVNSYYGGQLALAFRDVIIDARDNQEELSVAQLFLKAAEKTAQYFEKTPNYKSYGQMSQEFIIAGDQNLKLCGTAQ
jgi:hypothetical protein